MMQAIIFDFGQTLVDSADGFRSAEEDAQKRIFSDLRVSSWEKFILRYRKVRQAFHQSSRFSRQEIWKAVYVHFDREPNMHLLETWEIEYWNRVRDKTVPFPETQSVLKALAEGYDLALVTNTQGQKAKGTHRISLFPELEKYFSVIIVAGENQVPAKPDPAPFNLCLKRLGVDRSKAVYVGDDWRIDIRGAADAGIEPIWIQHHSVKRNWPLVETSAPIIETLNDLLDLDRLIS